MPRFHVQRSAVIHADPQTVFERIADFGTWTSWSPWLLAEPDARVAVSEHPSAQGATYAWEGEVVGAGEMEHLQLESPKRIEDEIRFLKPFKSTSQVRFDLQPVEDATRVTWHMHGALPWFMFWMTPAMEGYIGMDYERGLKMLKELIETGRIRTQTTIQGVQPMGPMKMAGVRKTCGFSEIGPAMDAAFREASETFERHGLSLEGERMSVYHRFDIKAKQFEFTSGHMLTDSDQAVPDELAQWQMPRMQALRVDHLGSYEHLGNAWSAANQHARYKKMKQSKIGAFELYKNDPNHTAEEQLLTEVYLPLK